MRVYDEPPVLEPLVDVLMLVFRKRCCQLAAHVHLVFSVEQSCRQVAHAERVPTGGPPRRPSHLGCRGSKCASPKSRRPLPPRRFQDEASRLAGLWSALNNVSQQTYGHAVEARSGPTRWCLPKVRCRPPTHATLSHRLHARDLPACVQIG